MLDPKDREVVSCKTCRDFGKVYDGKLTVDCPECSCWPPDKRAEMARYATKAIAEKPSITEADLSDSEKDLFAQWTLDFPHVHRLTLLTWIEGRRYDPLKDEEFLAEARKRYKKWLFYRHSNEGCLPEWVRYALATGDTSSLTKVDRQYVEELKGRLEAR